MSKRERIPAKAVTHQMLVDAGYYLNKSGQIVGPRGGVLKPRTGKLGYQQFAPSFGSQGKCCGYYLHRAVWMLYHGQDIPEGGQIDHINRVRDDNRPENLQLMDGYADHVLKDLTGRRRSNTPSWTIPNVVWHTGNSRWVVRFGVHGNFGSFSSFKEACEARNAKARELVCHTISQSDIDRALSVQATCLELSSEGAMPAWAII